MNIELENDSSKKCHFLLYIACKIVKPNYSIVYIAIQYWEKPIDFRPSIMFVMVTATKLLVLRKMRTIEFYSGELPLHVRVPK